MARRRRGIFGRRKDKQRDKRRSRRRSSNISSNFTSIGALTNAFFGGRRRRRKADRLKQYKSIKSQKGRVEPTFGITKPINPINAPTKPINDLGLKSNLPPISLSDRPKDLNEVEQQKDIVTKLDEGTQDKETKNILDRGIDLTINVVDEYTVNVPDIRSIRYPREIRGADFIGYDVDFNITFNVSGLDRGGYVEVGIGRTKLAFTTRDFKLNFNVQEILINYFDMEGTEDVDKIKIPISLTPVNQNLRKEKVKGETETFTVLFDKGDLDIPRSVVINRISEGFISQFNKCNFDDSTYLTHLLHLGNGDNKVITTWRGLKESTQTGADASSLILKLYEPLPNNIQTNQKAWITKIQTSPIIETLTLVGDSTGYCPPLQGPNFSLEPDNGIGYQVYDDLLASGSSTNEALIRQYGEKIGVDTKKLNIQYYSGSEYVFENFVHFGSAEERIKNFQYKIELLENYQNKYNSLSVSQVELGYLLAEGGSVDEYTIISEPASSSLQIEAVSVTAASVVQANQQLTNINNLIRTFDGFENFLYTSTTSLGYPKSGSSVLSSTSTEAISWYNSAVNDAALFDRNNIDYLNNNLPEFIKEDYQNEDFMLFMDMLGHHFDVIWAYINGLNNIRKPEHKADLGFSNDLVYSLLESLGWEGKKAYDSQHLWEYALGQYKDGTQKYQQSLKSANEEVWRRILNNLPYLLKHKGTSRSLKAVMACYGVPQSLLTIMEFGGPTDPTDGGTQPFTFDDRTAEIVLSEDTNEYIQIPWRAVDDDWPKSIEFRVNSTTPKTTSLIKGMDILGSNVEWEFKISQTTGSFANLDLYVSSSSTLESASIDNVRFFDGEYKQILINKGEDGVNDTFNLYLRDSQNGRIRTEVSSDTLTVNGASNWTGSGISNTIRLGNGFGGSLDEFRLWKTPLETNLLDTHTLQPDSIAGNSYTASAEDLVLRFDFEYPKDLSSSTNVNNVAISTEYNVDGTAVGFNSISDYPYHYRSYERTITAKVPSLGFNQADKIRFETQTLVGDLSHKVRATKKSLDRAPIDSSRLGLFFSPIKELNMDIIKSFGNFNIDNYIGAPADEYKDEYTELKSLRDYYFQRLNRDIYEYIRLIRYIDKSLFDVLEDLVPARAKVSKGLLIEPHFLERSKTKWEKPTSEKRDYETGVDVDEDVILLGDNNQFQANIDGESDVALSHQYDNYEANLDGEEDVVLTSTNPQYDSSIDVDDETTLSGNYPTYVSEINVPDGGVLDATAASFGFEQIGMDPNSLNNAGFGLFTPIEKYGEISTLDIFGNLSGSRQQVYLVKEQYKETISTQVAGYPTTTNNEQIRYEDVEVTKFRYKVTKVPFGAPDPTVGNDIVEVTALKGYLPSHYRYKNNLSQGLKNSFFEGSKQTQDTTPDGLSPVETFTTNPNILRVADTGRGSGEPILEVD